MVQALYFFLFNGFQKRRFGIFLAAVGQWLRHKTCWGSAFSDALPTQLSCFAWWLQFRSGWGTISLFLKVPKATFRHFSGCGFAMASAQNLLGFCFFACASETLFSWVWPGGLQASKSYVALCLAWSNLSQPFFFVFSRFQKQRFGTFLAAVSYGSGTILLSFLGTLYFFLFNGFQKRRFGIFLAAVGQWLRHKTCWGSAFSDALPTQLSWALPGGCSFAVAGARFHCF